MSTTRPARSLYLIHGDDPYRARLRAAELVASLSTHDDRPSNLRTQRSTDLGQRLGVTRHDARTTEPVVIEMSGQSQGLFDAIDELRVVVVEHAEGLRDTGVVARFPVEAGPVIVSGKQRAARARRAPEAYSAAAA